MEQKNLYTAIGRLERETNGCGRSCPVIRLGGQPYMVDMQELVVWTALNWRISKWEDISFQCDKLASSMGGAVSRPWDDCVNRLLTRGLLVSGCGETEYDALYDLLSSLGIIPTSGSALVRGVSFMKLVFSRRVSVGQALSCFAKTAEPTMNPASCGFPGRPCFPLRRSSNVWSRMSSPSPASGS